MWGYGRAWKLCIFATLSVLATLPIRRVSCSSGKDTGDTHNVLFIVVDNLRPSLGVYTADEALTPHMDSLATNGTIFSHVYCQEAWCSPSRNSFMSGRRPTQTLAYNFRDSFREKGVGDQWTTLPQWFKDVGGFTTVQSFGKVFHPNLPPNFDYPQSWTQQPFFVDKIDCPNFTMSCGLNDTYRSIDADYLTVTASIESLREFAANATQHDRFFFAVGFQAPRLPWSYPSTVLSRYPDASDIKIADFQMPMNSQLEWFRPTEIDQYSDVRL